MAEQKQHGLGQGMIASATAASVAEAVTIPLDTAKVRLQLQNRAKITQGGQNSVPKYRGESKHLMEHLSIPFIFSLPSIYTKQCCVAQKSLSTHSTRQLLTP